MADLGAVEVHHADPAEQRRAAGDGHRAGGNHGPVIVRVVTGPVGRLVEETQQLP
jgi:hypothetical protein